MSVSLAMTAGVVSTVVFAGSALPMLHKAATTKDLTSYSLGNLLLANLGNLVHSIYVFALPPGPIWALHSFYLVSSALMLFWYLRFTLRSMRRPTHPGGAEDAESARRAKGPRLPSVNTTTSPGRTP